MSLPPVGYMRLGPQGLVERWNGIAWEDLDSNIEAWELLDSNIHPTFPLHLEPEPQPQPAERKPRMNYSTAVFLINDKVRAIEVTYQPDGDGDYNKAKRYTCKSLDPYLEVGHLVVVPYKDDKTHGFFVCKVVAVDVDIDLDSSHDFRWIVGRVDLKNYEMILDQEKAAIEVMRSAEKNKRRKELRESVFADQEDKMKALQLTDLTNGEKK